MPHLSYEVYEALPGLGHALLRPVSEVELADGARLAVPGVRHLGQPRLKRCRNPGQPGNGWMRTSVSLIPEYIVSPLQPAGRPGYKTPPPLALVTTFHLGKFLVKNMEKIISICS